MENKINVAKILKDCPKGMELNCTMFDDVVLGAIESGHYPIKIVVKDGNDFIVYLTEFGEWSYNKNSKCIIFPKGKTTWEGFVPPHEFKDGDIIYTSLEGNLEFISIFKKTSGGIVHCYVDLGTQLYVKNACGLCKIDDIVSQRLATEDEKLKLFDAIKDNGYRWNAENKTLEKLIEPKFKEGDKVIRTETHEIYIIDHITSSGYVFKNGGGTGFIFENEHLYELAPNKFDINTLKPFESKVLVRHDRDNKWCGSFFSHIDDDFHSHCYKFVTTAGKSYPMCIPYEGNEHLIGKTDDCNDFYKTWK